MPTPSSSGITPHQSRGRPSTSRSLGRASSPTAASPRPGRPLIPVAPCRSPALTAGQSTSGQTHGRPHQPTRTVLLDRASSPAAASPRPGRPLIPVAPCRSPALTAGQSTSGQTHGRPPTSHSVAPLAIQSSPLRCGFERPGQHIARNLVHTAQLGHLITWRPISVHELGPLRGRGRLERSLSTNRVDCIAAAYHWGRIHPKPKQSDGR